MKPRHQGDSKTVLLLLFLALVLPVSSSLAQEQGQPGQQQAPPGSQPWGPAGNPYQGGSGPYSGAPVPHNGYRGQDPYSDRPNSNSNSLAEQKKQESERTQWNSTSKGYSLGHSLGY